MGDHATNGLAGGLERRLDLRVVEMVDSRAVSGGPDSHTFEYRLPARFAEQLVDAFAKRAMALEKLDALLQGVGQRDLAAPTPKARIVPLRCAVVQDDEVSDLFEIRDHATVVLASQRGIAVAIREVAKEELDAAGDEVDGRRLERLDEAGGKTERQAIVFPELPTMAGREWNDLRLFERGAVDRSHERRSGFRVAAEAARIDIAVSEPMLQRDAPTPAGLLRGRLGIGHDRPGMFRLDRNCAVACQVLRPVVESDAERFLDQEPFEAGAVDEEVAVDLASVFERQTLDESVRCPCDFRDAPFDAFQPTRFRIPAQVTRDVRGVDMQSIVGAADRRIARSRR